MVVSKPQSALFVPDERQRDAIEHVHGPMLVVAGAGTGKTSVLINRIARLVQQEHAQPEQMLALTYTVAAAGEMRDRGLPSRSCNGGNSIAPNMQSTGTNMFMCAVMWKMRCSKASRMRRGVNVCVAL